MIDQAGKVSKNSPGPSSYKPEFKKHLSMGKIMKCEGVGFMENTVHHAQGVPEPSRYKPSTALTKARSIGHKWITPKSKANWRPVKGRGAEVGMYNDIRSYFAQRS